jgi:pimeloyl-ACP methyl ester carboxylesterase
VLTTPIVFVPGLLCSAEVFAHQTAALWAFGPVMVASTLEGETVEQIATSILRDAPPRFALVGISFGGYVCMEIMRQAPDRVDRLALLDTSARPDIPEQSERRRAMLEQARVSDFATWVEEALTSIMHPSRHTDAGLRAINRRMGVTIGLNGLARQTEAAIRRPDFRPSLGAIHIPALVLVGEEDLLIPPERSKEIASLVPAATLVVIPKCGHSSTLEQPELVSSALTKWMQA